MSSFKRSTLEAMGVEASKIQAIMDAHMDVVNEITADRDKYKAEADKLPGLQKQLEAEQKKTKNSEGKDWQTMYEELVQANEAKEARAGKVEGYKGLLKSAKIPEAHWPLILKANAAEIDKLEIVDGKVKDSETVLTGIKSSLSAYIPKSETDGSDQDTPPGGDNQGGSKLDDMSMEDYIAARHKK